MNSNIITLEQNSDPVEPLSLTVADLEEIVAPAAESTPSVMASSPLVLLAPQDTVTHDRQQQQQQPIPETAVDTQGFIINRPDLIGTFGQIELPDTIEFGDQGQIKVMVTNRGNAIARGPVTVKLYISTDAEIDANDQLLTSEVKNLNLRPGRSISFDLDYHNNTSVIAPGSYRLIAEIDSANTITESSETNNLIDKMVSAPGTDMVLDWNAAALNAIQAEGKAGRGIPPTEGTRLLAMLHTAVYDAVNAFEQDYQPYNFTGDAPNGACLEAAAVGAAYRMLSVLIPEQKPIFDELLRKCAREVQDTPEGESSGFQFGVQVADQILALRSADGSDNDAPYDPPAGDYVWHPDAPNFTAIGPNWGQVTPWAIDSVEAFAPDGLDGTLGTELYATEIEEVRRVGGRFDTEVTTIDRTPDQTELTFFWAYDRADTFRPYGQLNQITQEVAVREEGSLLENARLFAALNVALADAAIVAWDAKYDYVQPRPDDVIAGGIADSDGLNSTVGDPDWVPLLDTPPFPDYISGHSTFGGAWAAVLTNFFGENYEFQAVSQELPGVIRSFGSFEQAGSEDALSRIYGGIHVREATITDAVPTGQAIGNFVAQNLFQAV